MENLEKIMEDNLIVIKPILDKDGSLLRWVASYRYVQKETGMNLDYIDPDRKLDDGRSSVGYSGKTIKEAVTGLLKYKRKPAVIK